MWDTFDLQKLIMTMIGPPTLTFARPSFFIASSASCKSLLEAWRTEQVDESCRLRKRTSCCSERNSSSWSPTDSSTSSMPLIRSIWLAWSNVQSSPVHWCVVCSWLSCLSGGNGSNRSQFKALFCKTHSVKVVPPKLVLLHFLWDQLIPAKNKMETQIIKYYLTSCLLV